MARLRSKRSRRSIALLEGLLLHAALLSTASAGEKLPPASLVALFEEDGASLGAGPGAMELYLETSVNGMPRGLAPFRLRDGELWARPALLRRLGFVLPEAGTEDLRLSAIPGAQVRFEPARQGVAITAPLELLQLPTTVIGRSAPDVQPASAAPGVLLNYDVHAVAGQDDALRLTAFTELRAFSGRSVVSSTALTQVARGGGQPETTRSVRLDTSWSRSFPDEPLTLRLGDTLTGSLSWSRPTRIAGIQLQSDFALQPYRVTAPLPTYLGSATLPSEVELYVNGLRQYSGQVPAGPFQLTTIPTVNSTGQAQVVLTDTLGRVTTVDFPLYGTHQLLARGLSDWSVELGAVRRNYGLRSFDYAGAPVATGTWRHGVSDRFTIETHGEATKGLAVAGVGGAMQLGPFGMVSGAVARSQHRAGGGTQVDLGYHWQGRRLHASLSGTRTQGRYLDVAARHGGAPPADMGQAQVGWSAEELGAFSLGFLYLGYPGEEATRIVNAWWSRPLGHSASVSLSLNQNLDRRADRSLFLGVTWSLDGGTSASTGMQRNPAGTRFTANAQAPAPVEGGFGWRVAAREGQNLDGGEAEFDYLGRYGRVGAGVGVLGRTRYAQASASGGVVFMGGQAFASRRIDDAFAVVSTAGVAGVPIKLENRLVGTTDANGMLLVTSLHAWQNNRIEFEPMQLRADLRLGSTRQVAVPSGRAGVLVPFAITPVRAASIVLVDASGQPLPVGSRVRANGQEGEPAIVGFDGVVYLDTLQPHNVLAVETGSGACRASFDFGEDVEGIPEIGPLRCAGEARKAP